jgi:hypothetical protein
MNPLYRMNYSGEREAIGFFDSHAGYFTLAKQPCSLEYLLNASGGRFIGNCQTRLA